jgi:hypothetical protein
MTHIRHRHFGSSMNKNGRLKFISPAKKLLTGRPYFSLYFGPCIPPFRGLYLTKTYYRGSRRGKWELCFAYFWTGKMGFALLELRMKDTKMGKAKPKCHNKDSCSWTFQSEITLKCIWHEIYYFLKLNFFVFMVCSRDILICLICKWVWNVR